jgi:hypothetical protein
VGSGSASARAAKRPATTDGAIALSNLGAQIAGAEAAVKRDPDREDRKVALVDLLLMRGEYAGTIADYERALEVSEAMVKAAPASGEALFARSRTRAALHKFTAATADLDEAERRGVRPDWIRGARASLFEALGRYDEALALRRAAREARPTLSTLGSEAAVLGEMGRHEEAARLFAEAPRGHRDVSPFPYAWLAFQEGLMWERARKPARARELFEAACASLPSYAHAASHLAAMEPYARAIERLRPIVERSDDPEYAAQLSDLLRQRGDATEADALLERAKARFDALVERHPEAFADHAARFWLGSGRDAQKALTLAKKNAEARATDASLDLLLSTAIAADAKGAACEAAAKALKLPYASEVLRSMATDVASKCPATP